jgi:3-methyladenine DNA glycosylase AlkD
LFRHLPFAHDLVSRWRGHEREFVRRAAFSLIAVLAVHDKKAGDDRFAFYLPLIEAASDDPSPMVRKAVNWALRQIGKRSAALNALAIETAERIAKRGGDARWVASDALRELRSSRVRGRLRSAAARPRAPCRNRSRSGSERR